MPSESQNKATAKYKKANYKRIPLEVKNEDYEIIKAHCQELGKPVNTFIKELIFKELNIK